MSVQMIGSHIDALRAAVRQERTEQLDRATVWTSPNAALRAMDETDRAVNQLAVAALDLAGENERFRVAIAGWYQRQGFPDTDLPGLMDKMDLWPLDVLVRRLERADERIARPRRAPWWRRWWGRLLGVEL